MAKVFRIDPTNPSLNQIVEDLNDMKEELDSIVIVYKTKEGFIDISYSPQKFDNLVYLLKALDVYITNSMLSTPEEE